MNDLWLSIKIISSIFLLSTSTTYIYCKLFDYPLYNKDDDNISNKVQTISINGICAFSESIGITYYFLSNKIIIVDNASLLTNFQNLFLYSLYIEFCYYIIHRIYHTKYFYKIIHKKHHETYDIYPIDTFYFTLFDMHSILSAFVFPVFFLKLNIQQFSFIVYFYLTINYILHSNLLVEHHVLHHKYMKCNYCIIIPYFDWLFQTYKS